MSSPTVWLTLQDAADHIKASRDVVRAAVKAGDLPAYPIGTGKEYRLTAEDVDEWMRSRAWEPAK